MRTLLVALACALLVGCGGDDGGSTTVVTLDTNETRLKVMLPGYEGDAIVEVDGTPHFVSGSAVHELGVFPEGTQVFVSLVEWDNGYNCWPTEQHAILVDVSLTVMYYCTRNDSPTRPMITSIGYPVDVAVGELESFTISAESPTGTPVLGFKLDVVSAPDGATFTHETPNTASHYQYFRMDTPGTYVIEVRAMTVAGLSYPFTINLEAYDPAPSVSFGLTPAEVYTDTDVQAAYSVSDNDPSSVTLTHVWYINDVLVPGIDGDTLPSHLFKKGDSIGVEIIAADPFNQITTPRKSVTVLDSPAVLDTSNIPAQVNRGTPLSIDLLVTDKDPDDTPVISLAYGPKGMEISNNTLQWQANPILITDSGLFHFGIAVSENAADVEDLALEVVDSGRRSVTIAAGGTTPRRLARTNQLLDYDNDGVKEAIFVRDSHMTIIDMVSGEVEWAINTLGPDRTQSLRDAVFVPRDGQTGLVAILSDHIDLIDPMTGQTVASKHLNTLETSNYYDGSRIDHVRGATQGNGFLVLSIDSDRQLVALDQLTLEVRWRSIVGSIEEIAVAANLDTDPQDEIVTIGGYVFDGESGVNQWLYESSASVYTLYQEDLGYSLGVYRKTGDQVRLVDFYNKSYTEATTGVSSFRAMGTGNLDADQDDELIVVGFSDTTVFNYNRDTQSLVASGSYPVPYIQEMTVVRDFTDDNKASIVGSSNLSLRLHNIVSDTSLREINPLCDRQNVVLLPNSADTNETSASVAINCYNDENAYVPFLVSMNTASKEIIYTEASSHSASALLSGMIDNDLNPDAVVGDNETLTGRDLATGTDTWSIPSPNTKHELMAVDINNDDVKEILSRNRFTVDIYDIISQSVLGQTVPAANYNSYILAAEIAVNPTTNSRHLVVGKENMLELYRLDENGATLLAQKPIGDLIDIALIDYNSDGITEIAVLRNDYPQDVIDIFDLDLKVVAQPSVPHTFNTLVSYPDSGTHLLGVRRTSRGLEVHEFDLRSSKITWTGPVVFAQNHYSSDYQKHVDIINSTSGLHLRIVAGLSAVIAW